VPAAAMTGAVVALGLAALFFVYQVRRIRRAAAVVPELYEGQSRTSRGGPTAWDSGMGTSGVQDVNAGRTSQRTTTDI
jgi:hypothetical protein